MLRILGGPKRLCDGITRRDLLHAGSIGLFGLNLAEWNTAFATSTDASRVSAGFGRAKSCIMIYLYGAPSQLETFDPKPDAPAEIRGELGTISSIVPGLNVCEGLRRMAGLMDRVTVLRSVTHQYPIHGVAFATTGIPQMELAMELAPRDSRHWPFIGSVVDLIDEQNQPRAIPEVPRNLMLPWSFSTQRVGEIPRAGPYGGFLGGSYDPVATQFVGKGTVKAHKTLTTMVWDDVEPYRGISPESRFQLSAVSEPPPGLTLDRLDRRRDLLGQFEDVRRLGENQLHAASADRHRALAYSLMHSDRLRRAFDLGAESESTRDLYGMTLLGQACLNARRLVEAGGRFVSVFWDEYGLAGTGWDTHWDHYDRMRNELLPGLDRTLSGLLIDLDRRGLLDETLVLVLSEHGRTPKITPGQGGGRDHWSRCYSVVMAGGGVTRGNVIGRSDKIGSDPVERPISPKDILATTYHLLGIDPKTEIRDRQGRPSTLTPTGEVIAEAIA